MLKITMRRRSWLLCGLLVLLMATTVMAQGPRTLVPGTPLTGTLNSSNLVQVYTVDGTAGQVLTVTATNPDGVPLAITLTDSAGTNIAQAYDLDITGQVSVSNVTLPTTDTYFVTLFKSAGVDSFTDANFTVTTTLTGEGGTAATLEPTAAATVEGTEEVTPESTSTVDAVDLTSTQLVTTSGLQVVLTWTTTDNLDLEVRDPVGGSLYWETPTVNSGGSLSANANQECTATTDAPTETASWTSGGIPTGSYEVLVYYQEACTGTAPVDFTIATTVDGTTLDAIEGTLQELQVFVAGFVVNADGTSELTGLSGIVTDDLPAPAATLSADATPITVGESVNGQITNADPYEAYTFEGNANDLVTIDMTAITGNNLDTFLFLLDPRGNVLNSNDDAADGNTNAQINGALLPDTGSYTIVATRYAKRIGGTQGNYTLTITSQATELPQAFIDLPRGPLEVRLLWQNSNDLQLLVRDPAGASIFDDTPQVPSGGRLVAGGNVNCVRAEGTPFSYIYWPPETPPRPGVYEVEIWFQSQCNDTTQPNLNLYVSYNGTEVISDRAQMVLNERYLTSFTLTADGQIIPSDGGVITGVDSLNYTEDIENALPIEAATPLNGTISQDNKFDLYVFTGEAGDSYNIAMTKTSGTLDPSLYLIGPAGDQIAANDDAEPGENTNSLISNLTLPADGQYIIIATHFGAQFGGTTGTYSLTLTQLN
jgi:hypothetical protein